MKIDPNGPAYPLPDGTEVVRDYQPGFGDYSRKVLAAKGGLTVRAWMATKIMAAQIANPTWDSDVVSDPKRCARSAALYTNALIAELNKEPANGQLSPHRPARERGVAGRMGSG